MIFHKNKTYTSSATCVTVITKLGLYEPKRFVKDFFLGSWKRKEKKKGKRERRFWQSLSVNFDRNLIQIVDIR